MSDTDDARATTVQHPQVETGGRRLWGPLAAFEIKAFRYLWLNSVSFALAQQSLRFAFAWLVLKELDGGAAGVGIVAFALGIPVLFLALPAGALADRLDRRRMLMASQLGALAVTGVSAVLLWLDLMTLPVAYASALSLGTSMALGQPVRSAIIPSIVPRARLVNAIAMNSLGMNVTFMVGPVAGGAIINAWGVRGAFTAAAVVAASGILALLPLRLPDRERADPRPMLSEIWHGLEFIARHRGLRMLFLLLAAMGILLVGPYNSLLPLIAVEQLELDALRTSSLFTSLAIGMMLSSLVLASWSTIRNRGAWFVGGLMVAGWCFAGVGASRVYVVTMGFMFAWGLAAGFFVNLNQTLIQSNTPEHLMGRVTSTHLLVFQGLGPAGSLLGGTIAAAVGGSVTIGLFGMTMFAIALLVFVTQPTLRRMS